VPKKTKTTPNAESAIESEKNPRARSTSKKKKSSAKSAPAPRKKSAVSTRAEPTDEEIQLRAYFISERRHRLDLVGDASSDWSEARRQLLSELGQR